MRKWLTDPASLTSKLTVRCKQFRVQLLRQSSGQGLDGECEMIRLPRRARVWEREVLLRCDGHAVVFARTVVSRAAALADWPYFQSLGEKSLGATLFADPCVCRGAFQFALLKPSHPVRREIYNVLGPGAIEPPFFARRSLFGRNRGWLLVTEVFLPPIMQLSE